jgi:putative membrane protein
MSYKLILTLLLTGTVLIFVIQNASVVEIKFLLWSFDISRALLYFILLSAGIIIGWLINSYSRLGKKQSKKINNNFS